MRARPDSRTETHHAGGYPTRTEGVVLTIDETELRDALECVRTELLQAEHVLCTDFSFDLAEPNYVRALSAIRGAAGYECNFERLLLTLFRTKEVSEEPLAYLMHKLRWEGVRQELEKDRRALEYPILHARPIDRILEAYDDRWENREFYQHL